MHKKHFGLLSAGVAVILTASCAASGTEETAESPLTKAATSTGAPSEPVLTSEEAFGDLGAIDFCELLDEQAVEGTGATVDFAVPDFRHCLVGVDAPSTTMTVMIGGLYDNAVEQNLPSEDEPLSRSVHRQTFDTEVGCLRSLLFADEIGIQVFAQGLRDAEQVDMEALCRVADIVTDGVVEAAFSEKTFPRTFGEGSLAELDACALLDDDAASNAFDDDLVARERVGGHGCTWGPPTAPSVELAFEVEMPVDLEEFSTKLGGRPTRVAGNELLCEVSTPHIPLSEAYPQEREILTVSAMTFDSTACDVAEDLAALVWPRLPAFRG
ncbi:hypothetical protein [Saccharomonospora sp. NB11]|uniref:hypothetical protein n=1 Tax=Saccharomonospora sp. NB11 TaxID=1642298 RepID=UPI0027DE6D0A|nr:hypothetical protein [Saccharomonospora sp. NB11]